MSRPPAPSPARGPRRRGVVRAGREGALLDHAVLDHLEGGVGQAGQVDQRNLTRLGGVADEARLGIGPAPHIAPALGKAGVDALADLEPFVVVDDLGGDDDALHLVVEFDAGELARGDAAVHGAHRAERLAAARFERLIRPLLEIGLARRIVADLARAVGRLGRGDSGDEPPVEVDLHERQEQVERDHRGSVLGRAPRAPGGAGAGITMCGRAGGGSRPLLPPAPSPLCRTVPRAE